MKQHLQNRILTPFIIFTAILTTILLIWSTLFLSKLFSQKDNGMLAMNLQLFEKQLNDIFQTNQRLIQTKESQRQLTKNIEKYLVGISQENDVTFHTEPEYLSLFTKIQTPTSPQLKVLAYKKDTQTHISLFHYIPTTKKPILIEYSLNNALKNTQLPKEITFGIMHHAPNKRKMPPTIISSQSAQTPTDERQFISKAFKTHTSTGKSNEKSWVEQPKKILIQQSTLHPSLYYYVANTDSDYVKTLIKIVFGMMILISLITASIFIIYSLIIKKMTTSIDILRSVSRKVAKGDFTQKVFIQSNDEIGELSETFNQMVTQLKHSTETILQQKDQSEAIVASIPDSIIVTDFKNKLIMANKQAEQLFDFKLKKTIKKPVDSVIKHSIFKDHSESLKTHPSCTSEFSYTQQKKEKILLMTSSQVTSEQQKPMGIIYLLRDITREKQIEELKEGFLRTVSHELRTPLTSVIGFIELVHHSADSLTNDQQSYLKTALTEATSLKTLINDLLDLSQIQAGHTQLISGKIAIKTLMDNVIRSLSPLIKGKELILTNHFTDDSLTLFADERKVKRILINLISNSIKFTEKGNIDIDCIEHEDNVEFSVKDTGIGIKPSEIDIIFEKFHQIDYSSTREYEGIGLGLSIVKQLVELHNGTVRVESTFGEGASFFFTIEKKKLLTTA